MLRRLPLDLGPAQRSSLSATRVDDATQVEEQGASLLCRHRLDASVHGGELGAAGGDSVLGRRTETVDELVELIHARSGAKRVCDGLWAKNKHNNNGSAR